LLTYLLAFTDIGINFVIKVGVMANVEPPVGFRVRAPGQGVRRRSPLKLKVFFVFQKCKLAQICPFLLTCKLL